MRLLVVSSVVVLLAAGCAIRSSDEEAEEPTNPGIAAVDETDEPQGDAPSADAAPDAVRIGVVGPLIDSPHDIDETRPVDPVVADLFFDALTEYDNESHTVRPGLAEVWSVSDDGLTWTFTLGDVAFVDGAPVTAADVVASFERLLSGHPAALASENLDIIVGAFAYRSATASFVEGLTVTGEDSLEIELTEPFMDLPALLSGPAYGVIGTGETTDSRWSTQRSVSSIDGGWAFEGSGDRIELFVFGSAADLEAGLVTEKLHAALGLDDAPTGYQPMDVETAASVFYAMNVNHPALADATTRLAIIQAIDAVELANVLTDADAVPMSGIAPAGAGSNVGCDLCDGGVAPSVDQPIPIDYYNDADGDEATIAGLIGNQLAAAGFEVEVTGHNLDAFLDLVATGQAGLFRYGWVGGYASARAYLDPFASDSTDNVFGFADPEVDRLLSVAATTTADTERQAIYDQVEERILFGLPMVPMLRLTSNWVVADGIDGFVVGIDGVPDYNGLL